MEAKGWQVSFFHDALIITNKSHKDERIVISKDESTGRITKVDVARGDNPTRVTRLDAKITYQEVVAEEGGTLVWPMK